MSASVKITIAEPSVVIRGGLLSILKKSGGFNADFYEIDDMEQLREHLNRRRPDILIVNPSFVGVFSLRRMRKETCCENMKCVALQYSVFDSLQLGEYDDTVSIYDSAERIRGKLSRLAGEPSDEKRHESLSTREKEVVACVVNGMTNKQIADKLFLSTHTVITHRRNIAAKLQIHSTAGLTIYAIVNKLVKIDEVKDISEEVEK